MKRLKTKLLSIMLSLTLLAACAPQNNTAEKDGAGLKESVQQTSVPKASESSAAQPAADGELVMHFIDVGQGDCIFLQTGKANMLIDSGNPEDGPEVSDYISALGVTEINAFVGSHPHEDHLGGAATVVCSFNIDEMIMTDCVSTSFFFEKLLNSLDERNVTVNEPPVGGVRNVGDMRVEFLAPLELGGDMNNNSIIMRVTFGEISAMFTGDAEEPAERELLSENVNLKSDILKVGHHGSRYSSSDEFLRAVSPKIAVIQSGIGNSYGHPHAEALSRLSACGAKVYRCDEQGTIVLKTDGKTITRGKPAAITEGAASQSAYVANIRSMKFHIPSCRGLPDIKNRKYYDKRADAVADGYSPCGICKP